MNTTHTHEEIAKRARKLWQEQGQPQGRDVEIWFEAERQLAENGNEGSDQHDSENQEVLSKSHHQPTLSESQSEHAQQERAKQQRKDARAPITPTKTAPVPKPPETGKPLWSKPHSA